MQNEHTPIEDQDDREIAALLKDYPMPQADRRLFRPGARARNARGLTSATQSLVDDGISDLPLLPAWYFGWSADFCSRHRIARRRSGDTRPSMQAFPALR